MPASCQRLLVQTHLVFSRSSQSPDPHSCQGRGEDRESLLFLGVAVMGQRIQRCL